MVSDGYVKKNAGQKDDNHHSSSGAGKKLEMEMALAKEPIDPPL
jgi:hypothetical protein